MVVIQMEGVSQHGEWIVYRRQAGSSVLSLGAAVGRDTVHLLTAVSGHLPCVTESHTKQRKFLGGES